MEKPTGIVGKNCKKIALRRNSRRCFTFTILIYCIVVKLYVAFNSSLFNFKRFLLHVVNYKETNNTIKLILYFRGARSVHFCTVCPQITKCSMFLLYCNVGLLSRATCYSTMGSTSRWGVIFCVIKFCFILKIWASFFLLESQAWNFICERARARPVKLSFWKMHFQWKTENLILWYGKLLRGGGTKGKTI